MALKISDVFFAVTIVHVIHGVYSGIPVDPQDFEAVMNSADREGSLSKFLKSYTADTGGKDSETDSGTEGKDSEAGVDSETGEKKDFLEEFVPVYEFLKLTDHEYDVTPANRKPYNYKLDRMSHEEEVKEVHNDGQELNMVKDEKEIVTNIEDLAEKEIVPNSEDLANEDLITPDPGVHSDVLSNEEPAVEAATADDIGEKADDLREKADDLGENADDSKMEDHHGEKEEYLGENEDDLREKEGDLVEEDKLLEVSEVGEKEYGDLPIDEDTPIDRSDSQQIHSNDLEDFDALFLKEDLFEWPEKVDSLMRDDEEKAVIPEETLKEKEEMANEIQHTKFDEDEIIDDEDMVKELNPRMSPLSRYAESVRLKQKTRPSKAKEKVANEVKEDVANEAKEKVANEDVVVSDVIEEEESLNEEPEDEGRGGVLGFVGGLFGWY